MLHTVRMRLRAETEADLAASGGGDSPFDDFGPVAPRTTPSSARLDGDGRLVVEDDAGQVAGSVSWRWNQWGPSAGSRCPMIGIWLRPDSRGRGLGAVAQRALAELFFRHTTTNRVEAHTDVENLAEQKALQRAGFQQEGCTRGAHWRDGAYHDAYLYAVLRTDPTPRDPR